MFFFISSMKAILSYTPHLLFLSNHYPFLPGQSENANLHHQLEAKKIHQQGKNRRASLELKQQL
jgi:hypothetical protein